MGGFNLSEWSLRHRSIAIYLMILAVAAGLFSYYQARPQRGPRLRHQDDGRSGRLARRDDRRDAEAGDRAARAQAAGDAAARLHPQLSPAPGVTTIFVNLKGSATAKEVPDIWYHVRKSIGDIRPTLPAGVDRARLQRRFRRHVRHHLRLHRRRLQPARVARLRRGRPLEAPARAGRLEDRDSRRAGRADLRRILDPGARQSRARPRRRGRGASGPERRAARPATSRPATRSSRSASRARSSPSRTFSRPTSPSAAGWSGSATSRPSGAASPIRRSRCSG